MISISEKEANSRQAFIKKSAPFLWSDIFAAPKRIRNLYAGRPIAWRAMHLFVGENEAGRALGIEWNFADCNKTLCIPKWVIHRLHPTKCTYDQFNFSFCLNV